MCATLKTQVDLFGSYEWVHININHIWAAHTIKEQKNALNFVPDWAIRADRTKIFVSARVA